jgi:hypothetical protein
MLVELEIYRQQPNVDDDPLIKEYRDDADLSL